MRIEILYDFDYESLGYFKNGLNNFPGGRFSGRKPTFFPVAFLNNWSNLESLNFLGTGLDKVCMVNSSTHSAFVIEPCSAMFFCCSIEEVFAFFLNEKKANTSSISGGGLLTSESFFRVNSDRGEDEISVGIDFEKNKEGWDIIFFKNRKLFEWRSPLKSFLSAYFEFGERMLRFYNHVIPEYKEFEFYYPLFLKAVNDSVIKSEFDFKTQSSYDDKTYYDFQ